MYTFFTSLHVLKSLKSILFTNPRLGEYGEKKREGETFRGGKGKCGTFPTIPRGTVTEGTRSAFGGGKGRKRKEAYINATPDQEKGKKEGHS